MCTFGGALEIEALAPNAVLENVCGFGRKCVWRDRENPAQEGGRQLNSPEGAAPGTYADRNLIDVIIIGAGFAGLYALYKLRGLGLRVRVFEEGDGVGGTWFWNRYPGARCDVESLQYSYSFSEDLEREWVWTEKFAKQSDILDYLNFVADKFSLRKDIQLETRVESLEFQEAVDGWRVTTRSGEAFQSRFVIAATGCLSSAKAPDIKGLDLFAGRTLFTGRWPKDGVDLGDKRVCVIGTGSSAIQAIPEIAKAVAHLTVFQRTANFSIPARNAPLTVERVSDWKSNLRENRRRAREDAITGVIYKFATKSAQDAGADERAAELKDRWSAGGAGFMHAYNDLLLNEGSNRIAADFVRDRIREIVQDPATAERLCPDDHPIGTKRICVDTDYFDTFNRANVELVSLKEAGGIEIVAEGVKAGGEIYACDVLVLATGFDAITGPLLSMEIRGRNGRSLRDKWRDGPKEYLGLLCAGFPNLLTITGPGSPSVISNVVVSIEQHVDFIANLLSHMAARNYAIVDADDAAEEEWMALVSEIANQTLYPKANSWYVGANVPGKPRGFMAYIGVAGYRKVCDEIARDNFRGFEFSS